MFIRKFVGACGLFLGLAGVGGLASADSFTVNDQTIFNHANVNRQGSIANALSQCEQTGGGVVSIASGVYTTSGTLTVGANCQLVGAGIGATLIRMTGSADAIAVSSGQDSVHARWSIEDIGIELPSGSSANAIFTVPIQANNGVIRNVMVTGGGPASWGIRLDTAILVEISHFYYEGGGSGIHWENASLSQINVGDSLIQDTEILLRAAGTVGIRLASPTVHPNVAWNYRVNNVMLSRVEVRTPDGVVRSGTTGIVLRNTARVTLLHVDLEQMDVGVLQQSGVEGGAVAVGNSLLQVFALGCNTDYVLEGDTPKEQVVLGGFGAFADQQMLPTNNIYADHPVMGPSRVLTAVRPIEAYSNSSQPRVLTTEDSGTVFTNKGATGIVTFNLPPANLNNSMEFEFHLVAVGQRIRILPAPGDLIRPGQTLTNTYYQSGTGWGQVLKIRNVDNTIWSVLEKLGGWYNP